MASWIIIENSDISELATQDFAKVVIICASFVFVLIVLHPLVLWYGHWAFGLVS